MAETPELNKAPQCSTLQKRTLQTDIIKPSISTDNNNRALKTSKKRKILKTMYPVQQKNKQQMKRLMEQNTNRGQKILPLETLLKCLKRKYYINEEQELVLNMTNVTTEELYSRQKNANEVSTSDYSPALRSFALTLHYYSSKAYDYAREVYNICIPHPHTIHNWYKNVDCSPGFTTQSLEALKLVANKTKGPLYCCLIIDEMVLREHIECDGEKCNGYVNIGSNLDTDLLPEAGGALVFLITGINANWKIPVGYFLIDHANGEQRATLVLQCLRYLEEANITVIGLSFNGFSHNMMMAKILGCVLEPNDMKTTFEHPVTKQPIALFFSASHMIELVRFCLHKHQKIIDGNGKHVSWKYLELLDTQQNISKIRKHNMNYHCKTKIATELLNRSVADSLDFYRDKLKIDDFKESLPTAEFIRIFNDIFDVLNSRNPNKFSYKQPLSLGNSTTIMDLLNNAEKYIKGLRNLQGALLIESSNKAGLIGLLVCIKSTKELIQHFIEKGRMKFISMYSFSRDQLEIFFSNARTHNGCNNEPTPRQFYYFYKKLISRIEIQNSNVRNSVRLEHISILNCPSAVQAINATTIRGTLVYDEADTLQMNRKKTRDIDNFCRILPQMTEFGAEIIPYIAGYVVRTIQKLIKCEQCSSVLSLRKPDIDHTFEFVNFEDKDGLVYPSNDAIKICEVAELKIRNIVSQSQYFNISQSLNKPLLISKILHDFVYSKIFSGIVIHQFDQSPTENHLINLIKAVADMYIDVRIQYINKYLKRIPPSSLFETFLIY